MGKDRKPSKLGRSIWSGSIVLGALNIPVKLYTGYRSERDQNFSTIHAPKEELEKAYEVAKGELIRVDTDALPKEVKSETLEITCAVPDSKIDAHHLRGKIYWVLRYFIMPLNKER
jgi:non-homologous end joining protein Ku